MSKVHKPEYLTNAFLNAVNRWVEANPDQAKRLFAEATLEENMDMMGLQLHLMEALPENPEEDNGQTASAARACVNLANMYADIAMRCGLKKEFQALTPLAARVPARRGNLGLVAPAFVQLCN